MQKDSKIYVAGHRGMVGSAIGRALEKAGFANLIFRTSNELDLRNQAAVNAFFETEKPEYVFLAAAKVGGVQANNIYRGEFLYENMMIEANVIEAARVHGVKKLLFLGSSCIYPRAADQPIKEEYLLTGPLEPTNEPYAIAKIAGIKLCESYRRQYGCDFIAAMPTNLYGPHDYFNLERSHVLPALIRRFHDAKVASAKDVTIWGTGSPLREFLHVDDLASACLLLMETYEDEAHINIGSQEEISIKDLAILVKKVVGFEGEILHDTTKPDGMPRKLMDSGRLRALGWAPTISLEEGIKGAYQWFLDNQDSFRT